MISDVAEFDQAKAHRRARTDLSAPARPCAAGTRRRRHHGRGAGAALSARRIAEAGRFRLGRLERPVPVPVRGRSRQRQGIGALRHPVGTDPARAARHRAQGECGEENRLAVRRDGVEAARRAGADRARLSLAVAVGDRARSGEGDDPRPRRHKGRGDDQAAAGRAGRQRVDPAEADGICGSRGAVVVARPAAANAACHLPPLRTVPCYPKPNSISCSPTTPRSRPSCWARSIPKVRADHARARRAQSADRGGEGLSRRPRRDRRYREPDRGSRDRSRDARHGGSRARDAAGAGGELEQKIRVALLPKDAMDDRNVVLEIRAGTGGDEASLFAGDLFRMYERFAALQGWKVEVISASEGTMGGYKEIIAEVQGRGAFAKLKFESGVHRVQRVPDTETQGRIHTSAATVAVLPEVRGSRRRHQER